MSHNIIIIINETLLKNLKIEHQKSLNFLESLNFITHARPPAGPHVTRTDKSIAHALSGLPYEIIMSSLVGPLPLLS